MNETDKEKLMKEWDESKLAERVNASEMFAINHGFSQWKDKTIQDWWLSKIDPLIGEERQRFIELVNEHKGREIEGAAIINNTLHLVTFSLPQDGKEIK